MNSLNKTFLPTEKYENRQWFLIDCKGKKLGRLATQVAKLLRGKDKPHYSPSVDVGSYVILINANSILLKGNRQQFSVYNPGRPGRSLKKITNSIPNVLIERAIKGMLSESEKRKFIKRLNIYSNQKHLHEAQNPIKIDI